MRKACLQPSARCRLPRGELEAAKTQPRPSKLRHCPASSDAAQYSWIKDCCRHLQRRQLWLGESHKLETRTDQH